MVAPVQPVLSPLYDIAGPPSSCESRFTVEGYPCFGIPRPSYPLVPYSPLPIETTPSLLSILFFPIYCFSFDYHMTVPLLSESFPPSPGFELSSSSPQPCTLRLPRVSMVPFLHCWTGTRFPLPVLVRSSLVNRLVFFSPQTLLC